MSKLWGDMKHNVVRYLLVFLGLLAGYMLFAFVANLLPNEPIRKHASSTIVRQDLCNDYEYPILHKEPFRMDNFTDALIVNQACMGGSDSLLTSMLLMPRMDYGGLSQTESLRKMLEGDDAPHKTIYYPRYWHGSTLIMRFLLQMDDYTGLRVFFYLLSSLILLWAVVAMGKTLGLWSAVLFLLSWLLCTVFVMQFSIQFLPVLLISLAATLWVLYRVKTTGNMAMLLFVIGSLTAFFDLLTCPLITWGVPMCVYLLKKREELAQESLGKGICGMACPSLLWALGYGGTWVSKWLIGSALTPCDVLHDGASQFGLRSGVEAEFTRWDAVQHNLDLIGWPYVCVTAIVLIVLAVLFFNRQGIKASVLCAITALGPFAWFIFAADHTYLHNWFAFRTLVVFLMGLFFALGSLVDWNKIMKTNRR